MTERVDTSETPARILHALAGAPQIDGCIEREGTCWLCGEETSRSAPLKKWSGAGFSDQNKRRGPADATHVCEACVWATSWVQPPGMEPPPPGKRGLNLRLFSHLYDAGEYAYLNKADKPQILAWLRAPKRGPWFATIADTGQKHALPWAELNLHSGLGGLVLFEEDDVALPEAETGWSIVDDAIDLLTWGVTKDELASGTYSARSWAACREELLAFERTHGQLRFSAWFRLATWLSQRDEEELKRRKQHGTTYGRASRKAPSKDSRGDARPARSVSRGRSERAEALDADRGPDACGDTHELDPGRVGKRDETGAPAQRDEQLSLALGGAPL